MNNCSYFIKDRAMFGSYPTQEAVEELEHEGVIYFVNLTHEKENKITPYITNHNYISYPIKDREVPTDLRSYSSFIINISTIIKNLKNKKKIYIHCKGGHGRSGVVVASILCHIFNLSPFQSLEYTTTCHNNRRIMKEKWRKIGSPQTYSQRRFIYKFFEPLKIHQTYKNSISMGFSILSKHCVNIENEGIFDNAYIAIKQLCINNIENKYSISDILESKITQHEDVYKNILNTYLRPIIYYSSKNNIENIDNNIGKILTSLRNKYHVKNLTTST